MTEREPEPPLPPPSARSLLLTVAGELLWDSTDGAWTTALLQVFAGLGIEDHAARQLLARSTKDRWLARSRDGRAVRWSLDTRGRELVAEGMRRSDAYLADSDDWDGRWLVLHVTIPQDRRTARKRLYGGLVWLGFGNPMPGVWITPHSERTADLAALITGLELDGTAFAVTGPAADLGLTETELVARAWDLTELDAAYRRLLDREAARTLPASADETLTAYLDLLNLQQRFMRRDPQLPADLQPTWIGREASAVIRERRAEWGAAAHARFQELVAASTPV